MGWAKYCEDNIEIMLERQFMMQETEITVACRTNNSVVTTVNLTTCMNYEKANKQQKQEILELAKIWEHTGTIRAIMNSIDWAVSSAMTSMDPAEGQITRTENVRRVSNLLQHVIEELKQWDESGY